MTLHCPMCNSERIEQYDGLVYHTKGNDFKCKLCGCDFGIYQFGTNKRDEERDSRN